MLTFADNNYKNLYMAIRAVCHADRRQIIEHLQQKGVVTVTALYHELKKEQSVTSHHLKILRDAKVVSVERQGKFRHYKLNEQRFDALNALASMLS